ncbi:MAG: caspase family protein [Alphaproteobacteria bacterium]|nr:caspase family protein [Alphaproteobacteria bacterium]
MQPLGWLFLPLIAAQLVALPAYAAERIALVIGNGGYAHVSPLGHVGSDTAVMADTLRSLDFDVEALNDLDRPAMQDQIEAFGHRIDQAGKETIGLLFYAGHGFQLEGSNYLLPVDAEITDFSDVDEATINLDLTLAEIAFATNDHKLVILDVPAEQAIGVDIGASPGLAAIDAPVGTLVAFGALPSLSDQSPPHRGLYPLALANALAKPGLMVEQVFQEVRLNVVEATDGMQIPWESSSLVSPVYLAGPPAPDDEPSIAKYEENGVTEFAGIDPRTVDLVFWTTIKESNDPADFVDYLNSFPEGVFRSLAERQLEDLADVDVASLADRDRAPRIEERSERLITQKRANVRAEPSSSGVIVATIEPNQTIEVTGKVLASDWLRVSLGAEIEAFIWEPLLGTSPPASNQHHGLAATLPPSRSALLGQWHGEYQCQWDTIGFTLDITDKQAEAADHIDAVFSFFALPGTPSLPSGSFTMSGDYDPEDGTIILKSQDWIDRPHGLQRHDLAGRAEIGGELISGRIETPGCSDFRLARGSVSGQATVQSLTTQ